MVGARHGLLGAFALDSPAIKDAKVVTSKAQPTLPSPARLITNLLYGREVLVRHEKPLMVEVTPAREPLLALVVTAQTKVETVRERPREGDRVARVLSLAAKRAVTRVVPFVVERYEPAQPEVALGAPPPAEEGPRGPPFAQAEAAGLEVVAEGLVPRVAARRLTEPIT